MAAQLPLILTVFLIFFFTETCAFIPAFAARKITHLVSGLLLLAVEMDNFTRNFVMCFAIAVPTFTWVAKPFRFTTYKDKGVALFGIVVFLWAYMRYPFSYLAPFFISDTLAALTGFYSGSARWHGDKTIIGSLTFFISALTTLWFYEPNVSIRFLVAFTSTFTEAMAGTYDNLFVPLPLLVHYLYNSGII